MLMSPRKSPVSPPTPKTNTVPSANSIGVSKRSEPLPHREHPVQHHDHRRDADEQREQHEALAEERAHAGHEHVVAVDHRGEDGHDDHRPDRAAVPVVRLAREEGEDVAQDPPRREDHDVDLGVAEDPEEVLPQDRIAAAARRRRARAGRTACRSSRSRRSRSAAEPSTGTKSAFRIAVSQSPQIVSGRRIQVMPGRAQADHGRDVVHRAHRRGDAGDEDRGDDERLAEPGRARRSSRAARRSSSPRRPSRDRVKNEASTSSCESEERPERVHVEASGTPCPARRS